jgi:predicted XRE-type DNA-binding protein
MPANDLTTTVHPHRLVLMERLQRYIHENRLTQAQAAKKLGVTQPRISYLMNGKLTRFTMDSLMRMAHHAGLTVRITITKEPTP